MRRLELLNVVVLMLISQLIQALSVALMVAVFLVVLGMIFWGGLLEIINAVARIGTAVVVFPAVKRHSEAAALCFVTARVIEAAVIIVGVISLLSIVTLRQDVAGATGVEAASMVAVGNALVAIQHWTALIGPGPTTGAMYSKGYGMCEYERAHGQIPSWWAGGTPVAPAFTEWVRTCCGR